MPDGVPRLLQRGHPAPGSWPGPAPATTLSEPSNAQAGAPAQRRPRSGESLHPSPSRGPGGRGTPGQARGWSSSGRRRIRREVVSEGGADTAGTSEAAEGGRGLERRKDCERKRKGEQRAVWSNSDGCHRVIRTHALTVRDAVCPLHGPTGKHLGILTPASRVPPCSAPRKNKNSISLMLR